MKSRGYIVFLGTLGIALLAQRPAAPEKLLPTSINRTSGHREEVINSPQAAQGLARSVGLVFDAENLLPGGNGLLVLQTESAGLATGQAFSEQPVVDNAFTGFLVGADLLLTTVHDVDLQNITDLRVVFGFQLNANGGVKTTFSNAEVFQVKNIEGHGNILNGASDDWLLLRLDRSPARPALPIASAPPIVGAALWMFGHPLGLPMKFVSNGKVTKEAGTSFECNLHASFGNSGSPVVDSASKNVVGVLQRAAPALDPVGNGVYVWHWCPLGQNCPTVVTGTPAFAAAVKKASLMSTIGGYPRRRPGAQARFEIGPRG